jgi:hypothetical protein
VSELVTNLNTPQFYTRTPPFYKKMEMAEMLKLLLARLDENAKTSQQIMLAMREEMIQEMRDD